MAASSGRKFGVLALTAALTVACQPTATSTPSSEASPSGSTSPTPAVSPTPTPGPLTIVWTDQPFSGTVSAVTVDQGQFIAVGGTSDSLSAWMSVDGTTWNAYPVSLPTPQQLGVDPFFAEYITNPLTSWLMMGRPARFGDTLLSVGTFPGPNDYLRPVGWRTTDLMNWEFIDSTNSFFTDGYLIADLVSSGDELVAVNSVYGTGGTWRWTPSTSWVQTAPNLDDPASWVDILDAVWADPMFVVVGERHPPGSSAVSWVSADGQSWQVSPEASALAGGIMRSVAVAPDGTIVVVGNLANAPTAWTSTDGLTWTSVALPGGGSAVVYGLASLETGLLAIADDVTGVLTWTSRDGVVWNPGPTLSGSSQVRLFHWMGGESVVAKGSTVTLFVEQSSEPNFQTVLWVGQVQP